VWRPGKRRRDWWVTSTAMAKIRDTKEGVIGGMFASLTLKRDTFRNAKMSEEDGIGGRPCSLDARCARIKKE